MTIPAYYLLIFFLTGATFPLLGVIIGAYFVWKTKREPHDNLFQLREPKGQAFNIKEDWETELPKVTETPEKVAQAANKFRKQFATHKPNIADKLGEEKSNA